MQQDGHSERYAVAGFPAHRLAIGCVALGLLVLAELATVHFIRGLSISGYLANRDPVRAAVLLLDVRSVRNHANSWRILCAQDSRPRDGRLVPASPGPRSQNKEL